MARKKAATPPPAEAVTQPEPAVMAGIQPGMAMPGMSPVSPCWCPRSDAGSQPDDCYDAGCGAGIMADPSAVPFAIGQEVADDDPGLNADIIRRSLLDNVYVLESQYHKGQTWGDFVTKYRYLVEQQEIGFVVIDLLNMLDPSRNRTADKLSALNTYSHEKASCVCASGKFETHASRLVARDCSTLPMLCYSSRKCRWA